MFNKQEVVVKRRKEVARLYMKGWFQADIAEKFGLTQQQISHDLKCIYRLWRQSTIKDFDKVKERELIKIDNLEAEYWKAWDESKLESEKQRKKYVDKEQRELNVERSTSTGDPRYLVGVQWCITKRSELLGLNAPQEVRNKLEIIHIEGDENL
jgi:acyl-CoA-binding protein